MTTISLRSAIKDAPTKEIINQRSLEHDTYMELVKAIIDRIDQISNREENNANVDQEVDEINGLIDTMRDKKVHPKCRQLHQNTIQGDFITAGEDESTLNAPKETLENQITMERALVEWNKNHHIHNRNKNREKYKE